MKSIKVKDYMNDYVLKFSPTDDMYRAIEGLRQRDVSSAPVVDKEGKLIGMLSQWCCLRSLVHGSYFEEVGGQIGDFMQTDLVTAGPDDDIVDVAEMLVERQWHHGVPILDGERLVGILSCSDILTMVNEFEKGKPPK